MRIIRGRVVPEAHLLAWFSNYARHLDLDVRYEIASAYTACGYFTTFGNVYTLAHAAIETNHFTTDEFIQRRNPAIPGSHTFDTYSSGVVAHMAHLCAYVYIDDDLDAFTKSFIKLSPASAQVHKSQLRGTVKDWEDLSPRWNTSPSFAKQLHFVAQTILG